MHRTLQQHNDGQYAAYTRTFIRHNA